jgi:hypothetical protein
MLCTAVLGVPGSCHNYCVSLNVECGENHEPPRFCIEVSVPRGGRKLHHGANPESAIEATVDIHCKTKHNYLVM